jgi:hypothetical protein
MTHKKLAIALVVSVIMAAAPATQLGALTTKQYYANTASCTKAIKSGKVVTIKTFNTCWNGVVRSPAPCWNFQAGKATGQKGQLVVVARKTYLLHVGSKPVLLPKGYTAEDENKGCSTPKASTTTTISTSAAGSAYLTAVAPANTAISTFTAKADAWTNNTTDAVAEADAQPLIAAFQKFDTTLTNAQWPAGATADVHTLIGDVGALVGDLQGLSTFNALNASSWEATLERDLASMSTAVALVRHDLGLPPATPAG